MTGAYLKSFTIGLLLLFALNSFAADIDVSVFSYSYCPYVDEKNKAEINDLLLKHSIEVPNFSDVEKFAAIFENIDQILKTLKINEDKIELRKYIGTLVEKRSTIAKTIRKYCALPLPAQKRQKMLEGLWYSLWYSVLIDQKPLDIGRIISKFSDSYCLELRQASAWRVLKQRLKAIISELNDSSVENESLRKDCNHMHISFAEEGSKAFKPTIKYDAEFDKVWPDVYGGFWNIMAEEFWRRFWLLDTEESFDSDIYFYYSGIGQVIYRREMNAFLQNHSRDSLIKIYKEAIQNLCNAAAQGYMDQKCKKANN